jgi:hypothetical protein
VITDIPSPADFSHAGIAFLNLAWDTVLELVTELDAAELEEWDTDGTVADEYWKAAQRQLATSVSPLQQGSEFLLKSRIVDVSPFLLLDGSPKDWPRGSDHKDVAFSSFKTIDAQELIRAHDVVSSPRLSQEFVALYDNLRRVRNTVMHTIDPQLRFTAKDIIVWILEIVDSLLQQQGWMEIRQKFLETDSVSVAHSSDYVDAAIAKEGLKLTQLLQPSQLRRYFDFNPKQRRYFCPSCQYAARDWDLEVDTAQLRPNTLSSTILYCFVCRKTHSVARKPCSASECKGNVLDATDGTCLTCWT